MTTELETIKARIAAAKGAEKETLERQFAQRIAQLAPASAESQPAPPPKK